MKKLDLMHLQICEFGLSTCNAIHCAAPPNTINQAAPASASAELPRQLQRSGKGGPPLASGARVGTAIRQKGPEDHALTRFNALQVYLVKEGTASWQTTGEH